MSRVFLLSSGIASDPSVFASEVRYRKATRNMILANNSMEKTLAGISAESLLAECGLVFGSSHGELEVTMNFLRTLAESGLARPILFQNSLHNSTTGYLTMTWKIQGPMITVSNRHFTGEDTLETAMCLLRQGSCRFCLTTAVEARVTELCEPLRDTRLRAQYSGEGAATLLLCNEEGLREWSRAPLCEVVGVSRDLVGSSSFVEPENYYDSNALECFARAVNAGERSLQLSKPDGSFSQIQWTC